MLATVRDGQGAVTIVEGASGIRKSRLPQEAAAIAVRAGVRVGIGAAAGPGGGIAACSPPSRTFRVRRSRLSSRRQTCRPRRAARPRAAVALVARGNRDA